LEGVPARGGEVRQGAGQEEGKNLLGIPAEATGQPSAGGAVNTTPPNHSPRKRASVKNQDDAYLKAVKKGDTATAQRMVEERRKKAGLYDWAGIPWDKATTISNSYNTPAYFTSDLATAKKYGTKARKTFIKPGRYLEVKNRVR